MPPLPPLHAAPSSPLLAPSTYAANCRKLASLALPGWVQPKRSRPVTVSPDADGGGEEGGASLLPPHAATASSDMASKVRDNAIDSPERPSITHPCKIWASLR